MNLNPLFIFEFDRDGWPLCPRCGTELTGSNLVHKENDMMKQSIAGIAKLIFKSPLTCSNCDWKTPTALNPNHTLNLANCTVSLRSKWEEMTNSLPRLKLQECGFDLPKATHCWKMWFGFN
jgi:hypothetical protein